jgi:Tol biopolymer transport system component
MSTFAIQHGLVGFIHLLTTAVAAGWVGAPMSWSPDARWLSYTVAPEAGRVEREPGWLFDASRRVPAGRDGQGHGPSNGASGSGAYRIWASQRDGNASVLIEESAWPLTAATWSPHGRSVAFGRFVPDSMGQQLPSPRGRLEVVIQDGLNRKRTLLTLPGFELDDVARARFPHVGPAWSPDGQYLAFPKPGRIPSLLIIRVDTSRLVRMLDRAMLPAWSPDGSRLAFLREEDGNDHSLRILERQGQAFVTVRAIMTTGRIAAPLSWCDDGRWIFAVIERPGLQVHDLDLARIQPETGELMRVLLLTHEGMRRGAATRGVAIDFSRDEDLCFYSVDFDGRDTQVMWTVPRERQTYKPFHPLDQSLRVVSLSLAPDGHALAMRFGTPGDVSQPAIFSLATERTTLIVPDESARRGWLELLVRTSRTLLDAALPPVFVDGQPAGRPTVLPLPDEIPRGPMHDRLARLGRYGSAMCVTRRELTTHEVEPETEAEPEADREDRLFFDYLRGDFVAATADLEALEPRLATREQRLAVLSLRAQVLWAQGETTRAREVAGYLLEAVGGPVHRVEETPLGRSLVPESGSGRTWARYLAARTSQPPAPAAPPAEPPPGERDDPMLINPFAPPELPGIEFPRERVPGVAVPFAPPAPGVRLGPFRARLLRLEPGMLEEPPPPPRPR